MSEDQRELRVHLDEFYTEDGIYKTHIYNCDGIMMGSVPKGLTKTQIKDIVSFANGWYGAGLKDGRQEVKTALRTLIGAAPAPASS